MMKITMASLPGLSVTVVRLASHGYDLQGVDLDAIGGCGLVPASPAGDSVQ
jgi:hypothetical protein